MLWDLSISKVKTVFFSFFPRVNVDGRSVESQKIQKKSVMMTKWRHLGLIYSRQLTFLRDQKEQLLYCADLRCTGGSSNPEWMEKTCKLV